MVDTMKETSMLTRRKWWLIGLSFIICHLSFCPAGAQTFTEHLQQATPGGRVTIHQDADINNLVNGITPTPPAPRHNNDRQGDRRQTASTTTPSGGTHSDRQQTTTGTVTTPASPATDSVATTVTQPTRLRKVAGYRVQAFVGGKKRTDKQKAVQTGNRLRTLFPGHRVHVHFLGGRWTCRLGDFRTKAEASEMLNEVVRLGYDTATLVRERVEVPY